MTSTYQPSWESLDKRPVPEWFNKAKFGIFIHWGVYSVPAWAPDDRSVYAEWYWHSLNNTENAASFQKATQEFHRTTYGADFTYQEFAPKFGAELFDADEWMNIIKSSGAKYVVPTTKHHDGYCLWPSAEAPNWNACDVGPKRNLIKELVDAARKADIVPGLYFSLYEWFHPLYRAGTHDAFIDRIMLPQLRDLVTSFEPKLIFADGEWDHPSSMWRAEEFLAWLYNDSPVKDDVIVNDRWGNDTRGVHGGYFTPEYSNDVYLDHKWEENRGLDQYSFGYNRNTKWHQYMTSRDVVLWLVRCVAQGGNLLLDIGPTADGRIPSIMAERLAAVGNWLAKNGDAIYGSDMWRVQTEIISEEDSTVYYTLQRDANTVYAILPLWPTQEVALTGIQASENASFTLVGYSDMIEWKSVDDGVILEFPARPPLHHENSSQSVFVVKCSGCV